MPRTSLGPTVVSLAVSDLLAPLAFSGKAVAEASGQYLAYVGTFTGARSQGIYAYRCDARSSTVTPLGCVVETVNPAFLALNPAGTHLYAVNEIGEFKGAKTGAVSAFAVDRETGRLRLLNQVSSAGPGPCHLTVDASGRQVLVANYTGGSVAVLPILPGGSLGEATARVQHSGSSVNPDRQREPHAHCVALSPDNRFAFVADLGIDQVKGYRFDPTRGTLTANDPAFIALPPGSGPRHLAFHPDGRHAYVITELLSTVSVLDYAPKAGAFSLRQTVSTLPDGFTGRSTAAEIAVHPSGRYAYGSNRGHDSVVAFAIASDTGELSPVQHIRTGGKTPRHIAIDPLGHNLWVENQDSDNITVFRIDELTGRLDATGPVLTVGSPVCVQFLPLP